nr:MAG TPA: hypothetical protein [Bacteriophage sp.]
MDMTSPLSTGIHAAPNLRLFAVANLGVTAFPFFVIVTLQKLLPFALAAAPNASTYPD